MGGFKGCGRERRVEGIKSRRIEGAGEVKEVLLTIVSYSVDAFLTSAICSITSFRKAMLSLLNFRQQVIQ